MSKNKSEKNITPCGMSITVNPAKCDVEWMNNE